MYKGSTGVRLRYLDSLPQIYRSWWRAAELDFNLRETKAQCSSCNLAQPQERAQMRAQTRDGHELPSHYRPDLKCCTFFPEVSNFATGAILSEKNLFPEVKVKLEEFLLSDEMATPLGLFPTSKYRAFYLSNLAHFGKLETLRCPYFLVESQRCGIWNHRPSPCVRFVCQSSYGMKGQALWGATEDLLNLTEQTLAHDCLLQMGFTSSEIKLGDWAEYKLRKAELYRTCHLKVAGLSAGEVWNLLEPEGSKLISRLKQIAGEIFSC